jgi:rod shape determining protein RodA
MADFQRWAPEARRHLKKGPGLWLKLKLDPWLLLVLLAIMSFGLLVLYSGSGSSETAVNKQLVRYGLALLVMVIITQVNLRHVQRWIPLLYIAGLLLLVAVLLFGAGAKGAQRWLEIPGLPRFQPS